MWDERYAEAGWAYGTEPNDFLVEVADAIPAGGRVLCLGDGQGRNGVFLAGRGHAVTAMDLSSVGMERGRELSAARGVHVDFQVGDLATYDLGVARWDAIVSIWVHLPSELRRAVHARVVRALAPGGVFLLEAYSPEQPALGTGGPPSGDLLVTVEALPGELAGLILERCEARHRIVHEGRYHHGESAVVQVVARARG
jgi:SAM-dependent methyltransferase